MLIHDCQRMRGYLLSAGRLGMVAKDTTVLAPFAVAGVGDAVPSSRGAPV